MTGEISRRSERLVRALALTPGVWDVRDRRVLRLDASGSFKRMTVPHEVEAELVDRGLVVATAGGLALSPEGRALLARLSGEDHAYRLQHGKVRQAQVV
ncbi:MAG: hypothetical protein P4L82_18835, partial [Ancalomicrobiaceae bacterium]|nr:hypothetical protein [Ancalomicrobiaceae bacterium]